MSISRLKLLGYLAIAITMIPMALWMSPERGKFSPFRGINQAVAQNRPNTQQQRRIALVIGNASYAVGKLDTPLNDAEDMATTLKGLGFEVILLKDTSKRQMEEALDRFYDQLRQGHVGLFYYAGHGMQIEGENYLIPVNAAIKAETDIQFETVPLGKILGRMASAGNGVNIVILDACRDNPFRSFVRSPSRGLTAVQSATGTLIAFATAPGKVASDGTGRNGLFTSYLLKYIKTPNLDVDLMLRQVRADVASKTNNYQVPWTSSSLIGEFAFNPKVETTTPIVTNSPSPKDIPVELVRIAEQITVEIIVREEFDFHFQNGSGVIFAKKGNSYYVATNEHVVRRSQDYFIAKEEDFVQYHYPATIVYRGPYPDDVAILKFSSNQSYLVPKIGNPKEFSPGTNIYVAGFPFSDQRSSPSLRLIEGTFRINRPLGGSYYSLLYTTTAVVEKGMSGGLILNTQGEVIGIHQGLLGTEAPENKVGVGIPITFFTQIIEKLR